MATINSNGTGGGPSNVGSTWEGGVVPGAADYAEVVTGDTVNMVGAQTFQCLVANGGTINGGTAVITSAPGSAGGAGYGIKNGGTINGQNATFDCTDPSTGGFGIDGNGASGQYGGGTLNVGNMTVKNGNLYCAPSGGTAVHFSGTLTLINATLNLETSTSGADAPATVTGSGTIIGGTVQNCTFASGSTITLIGVTDGGSNVFAGGTVNILGSSTWSHAITATTVFWGSSVHASTFGAGITGNLIVGASLDTVPTVSGTKTIVARGITVAGLFVAVPQNTEIG